METKPKALIVDDETDIIQIYSSILSSKLNYEVKTAENGNQGLALAQQVNYDLDLVITDINMLGIDGIEMVDRIRNIPQSKKLYIIFMSGKEQKRVEQYIKQNSLENNAVFLQKPFRFSQVLSCLQKFGLPYEIRND